MSHPQQTAGPGYTPTPTLSMACGGHTTQYQPFFRNKQSIFIPKSAPMLDVLRMYITSDPATNPSASHLQGDIEKRRLYPQMSRSGIPLSAVPTKSGPFSRRIRHFRHIVAVIVSSHCPTFFIKFTDKDGKASYRSEGDNDSI